MKKHRSRPWWYLLLRNAGPVLWLLAFAGFMLLLGRAVVYLVGGPRLWF